MDFLPSSQRRLCIIAIDGMDDAGQSAVDTAAHLVDAWALQQGPSLLDESYFDLTLVRPRIRRTNGRARIEWPGIETYSGTVPGTHIEVRVLIGPEPTFRWADACREVCADLGPGDRVILLGAASAAVSHRRPLPVSVVSEHPETVTACEPVDAAAEEGPSGIIAVLAVLLAEAGLPAVSLMVSVPGYVAGTSSPKAVLALLGAFEDVTGLVVDQHDLVEEARAWEHGVEEFVAANPDLDDHVEHLESVADTSELPEAKGEAIAREFERYLQHRRHDGG